MSAGLIIAADLAADPQCAALQERLRLRLAPCAVLMQPATPKTLLNTLRTLGADPTTSWLATRNANDASAAATAGMLGVVIVGSGTDSDDPMLVRHASDLASVPIAMVPRGGGCWHGG